jgi:formate-dependent phosphoribosylglycinamide formyltransferase (GAR transformylase)
MSFDTLLVANRGEIARRIIRSAHAMGIRCVAVYVDSDADAPFVRDADEAVRLETSYLDAAAILEAARATGAAAVHPGYGFLSENAAFAAQVGDAGLVWVGPSPDAIEQMGDKIAAKALAEKAQVPTLSGSLDPRAADQIGYPLLVKAAAGGGGKGMRVVESADSLAVLGMTASSSSATSRARVTSNSRFWATRTATWCTWASASVPSSAATRRSSRSRPHRVSMPICARRWAKPHCDWRGNSATNRPAPSSSCSTMTRASSSSWK